MESSYKNAIIALKKGDWQRVLELAQAILKDNPDHAGANYLMGLTRSMQGKHKAAEEFIKKSIQLSENKINLNALGVVYLRQDRALAASKCFKKALSYDNKAPEIYNNLAQSQLFIGNSFDALNNFHRALSINCNTNFMSNYLLCLNYISILSPKQIYQAHIGYSKCLCKKSKFDHLERSNERTIRIGYVSSHFCYNPIYYFLLPVLKCHDKKLFTVCCYSDVRQEDEITEKIKQYVSEWNKTVHMSDDELANKIYQDRIDILVDLSGHVSNNRLPVFARQPARFQFTWLGYPNTTGLSNMHYRFTDAIADPPINDACHSEELIRLSPCFLCYSPDSKSPPVSSLPADKNKIVTLGSFNNLAKVNETVISLWSDILKSIPETRLLIKACPLAETKTQEYLINKFKAHGLRNEIICLGFVDTIEKHLAMYEHVDLALDPFPYNGTTTTCEALWMGVPVLTRCGQSHASRVGASILSCIGLTDFICYSSQEYVSKAVYLCQHVDVLRDIRQKIRSLCLQSALMDKYSFTQSMESAYKRLFSL